MKQVSTLAYALRNQQFSVRRRLFLFAGETVSIRVTPTRFSCAFLVSLCDRVVVKDPESSRARGYFELLETHAIVSQMKFLAKLCKLAMSEETHGLAVLKTHIECGSGRRNGAHNITKAYKQHWTSQLYQFLLPYNIIRAFFVQHSSFYVAITLYGYLKYI